VNVALRQTFLLGGLHPLGNPLFELFDGIAANGKLENVKWHERQTSRGEGADQSFAAGGSDGAGESEVGAAGAGAGAGARFAAVFFAGAGGGE
jgi:hypothetical protein